MKVLVTGSTGLLGTEMLNVLSRRFDCRGLGGRVDFPVTEKEKVEEIIVSEQPDIIVHTAGCRDFLLCDENPREAFRVNALGTRNVTLAAEKAGAGMVYISSDLVFSGEKGEGYYEFDCPDPASVYGWSKWWGEYYVMNVLEKYYILRVPLLFGQPDSGKDNILNRILEQAGEGEEILLNSGVVTNPTWTVHVADVVSDLIDTGNYGTYHAGSTGFASMPQFAAAILEKRGLDPGLVREGDDNKYPSYNVIQSAVLPYMPEIRTLPGWREALEECIFSCEV